jgi:hypothetical protein
MRCIDENYVQHTITYNCERGNGNNELVELVARENESAV